MEYLEITKKKEEVKVKKKIMILAGIMVMALATATPVFARTWKEANAACENAGGKNVSQLPTGIIKCDMGGYIAEYPYDMQSSDSSSSSDSDAAASCSRRGGSYDSSTGQCNFSGSGSSGGGSSSSISDEIKRQREACEAKGGTYSASVSGGYVSGRCTVDGVENTILPDNGGGSNDDDGGSSGAGGENGSGGVTWNTDNSSAQATNPCGNGVMTNLFGGCVGGDSDGNGVFTVLNVILNVLTWGIGIAGTLGIVITGIQYMTAKDDVAQMAKAKNRLIQIVIGLAIYAVMWAFLQWLLPGGVFGNG